MTRNNPDAIVVGSGPNGLAAAITLARAGRSVRVYEAAPTVGGGMRSQELTRPGFIHDVCSAIHPFGVASPFLRELPLQEHGLEWIHPEVPVAHPLPDGRAAIMHRDLEQTVAGLGVDGPAYRRLMEPVVRLWPLAESALLGPVLRLPRHPLAVTAIGLRALVPTAWFGRYFREPLAPALMAGLAGHSLLPMEALGSSAVAIVLGGLAHQVGWPLAAGGSQRIAEALTAYLKVLGGEVVTDTPVESLEQLGQARAVLFDTGPRAAARLLEGHIPTSIHRALMRFRLGPGAFKVDYALDGPIPWRAAECAQAGTVHLGGTLAEIARSEAQMASGREPDQPYLLLAQQSLFDRSRAPRGQHTCWAYCHVPHGSRVDMQERITAQIERFAPGFRDRILACHTTSPAQFESYNANYVGGDVVGGSNAIWSIVARPRLALDPYFLGQRYFLCSASTPPGGGVHGMCGFHAARSALVRAFV